MVKETFVASTPQEAFQDALAKYGAAEHIQVVAARQFRDEAGRLRAEITIEVPDDIFKRQALQEAPHADTSNALKAENEALLDEIMRMKEELAQMRQEMLRDMEPPAMRHIKTLFVQKGLHEAWVDEALSKLPQSVSMHEQELVSYLLQHIDASITVKPETLDAPMMMMLIGPTGVGKTTTIAKLAARYAYLLDKPKKVALINLDSYKVGAVEQLAHYAEIMQIEHHTVATPEAFLECIESLGDYDVILVDTAGMSPYDTKKFIKVIEFVQLQTPRKLEVHLTLAATVKYEDMDDIYQNFSFLNPTALIVSKFDETRHLGTLLNFMLTYKLPLSYFSVGQEVPDDLRVASKEYVLERFIDDVRGT